MRLGLERFERIDGDQPALAYDPDPVGDAIDLRQDVRGQEHRRPVPLHLANQLVELLLHQRVEPCCWFVEDVELRLVHEGIHDAHLLAVSCRVVLDLAVQIEIESLGELFHVRLGLDLAKVGEVDQVLAGGHCVVEREVTRQVPRPAADLHRALHDVQPENLSGPVGWEQKVEQRPDRRRFPRTIRAEEPEGLADL